MTRERGYYAEIFLICFAALLLEVSYTRVISFKLFYYYSYLIIGFALLGMGSGGVIIAVAPRLRRIPLPNFLAIACLGAAASVGAGYFVVARIPLSAFELTSRLGELPKLVVICSTLFTTFLCVGLMVAALFSALPHRIHKLYFADLLGAGLACATVVPLLGYLGAPACIALGGLLFAATGLRLRGSVSRSVSYASAVIALLFGVGVAFPDLLPKIRPDSMKTIHPDTPSLFSQWSPVFRIDVTKSGDPEDRVRIIHHDGLLGSTIHRYDGDPASLGRFATDDRSFPFRVLGRPPRDVLIIGAAGGHEILASLHFDAERITAVELNPVTVSLLTTWMAEYSGNLSNEARVNLVNAEGRSFLARSDRKYDVIYFVAPDSYSAMNAATASAFVLSESYLYTSEMIEQSLLKLTDDGVVCMQFGDAYDFKPKRTARYVGTARVALERLGVKDVARHILVATSPSFIQHSTILLKRLPFTPEEVERFIANTDVIEGSRPRHAWGRELDAGPVNLVISAPQAELDAWYAAHPYDLRPISDDAPFFWHFARFRSALAVIGLPLMKIDHEDSIGETLLLLMLVVSSGFAAVFLLLPFLAIRSIWVQLPRKLPTGVYFASLGLGFMLFEICMIQKLTLFLGYPTYSLSITLMAILVFTGLGSLVSESYAGRRNRALGVLLGALVVLTLFYQFGMNAVMSVLLPTPLPVRAAATILLLAPLGLCLGAFMPLGLSTVSGLSAYKSEYIAWSWAVNGLFSVIGSVLTTMLSMTYGFRVVLFLALMVYVVAASILRALPLPARLPAG